MYCDIFEIFFWWFTYQYFYVLSLPSCFSPQKENQSELIIHGQISLARAQLHFCSFVKFCRPINFRLISIRFFWSPASFWSFVGNFLRNLIIVWRFKKLNNRETRKKQMRSWVMFICSIINHIIKFLYFKDSKESTVRHTRTGGYI